MRIFGPVRLEKLRRQLKAQDRDASRAEKLLGTRLRKETAELDRRIHAQVRALEDGVEPELVTQRIAELRTEKEEAEAALGNVSPARQESEADYLLELSSRSPT